MSKGKATGIIIPDDVRKIIEDNQTEKGIPTFTGSLCEIVRRQNEQQKISADVLDELKQFLANEAVGIRLSSRQAERNSAVLIRAVNQLLHIANVAAYFDEDNMLMKQAKALTDAELENYRQMRMEQRHRKQRSKKAEPGSAFSDELPPIPTDADAEPETRDFCPPEDYPY